MADQEIDNVEVDGVEVDETLGTDDVEVELNEDGTPKEEAELDDEGNPIEKEKEVPAWQSTDEEEGDLPDVAVGKHIKMKSKLKGRIKDRDETIDRLETRIKELETSGPTSTTELPTRPKSEDFDSDAEYEKALDEYEDKRLTVRLNSERDKTQTEEAKRSYNRAVAKAVDSHYDRSAELAEKNQIKPEYFKEADSAVRETVDAILPRQGDGVTDHIISLLGEGSEKVMYFLGRNKAARTEFQSLLAEDKTGMKAMVYLGQQKERLTNPKKLKSGAPKPASNAKGDLATNQKGSAMKKKYDAAHKKGNAQAAFNLKKEARALNIDVSSW